MKSKMRFSCLLIACVLFVAGLFGSVTPPHVRAAGGVIALSSSTLYTQNFDAIGNSATASLPEGWKAAKDAVNVRNVGFFSDASSATDYVGGNNLSTTASNGIYNFGAGISTSALDRAVGFLSSSSATKSGNLYAHFSNTSGSILSPLTISYNIEKYRNGSNASGFTVQLYYSFNGTDWISAGSNFQTKISADANNNGFSSAPGTTVSVTNQSLIPAIPTGSHFYLAWNYSVSSGTTTSNAQGLAIDDFSISAADCPACSTDPIGIGSANLNKVIKGETTNTLFTVSAIAGSNPSSTNLSVTCDLTSIGGIASQNFFDDGTHGDGTAGDSTFSYSATLGAITSGIKKLPCIVSDDQVRSSSATISLTVYDPVVTIGSVNGQILDTTDAPTHNATLKASTVSIRGVIYQKTLQAISNSLTGYYGFFIQNTTSQSDNDPLTSDGLFVFMSTSSTINAPGGTTYMPTVGDEVTLSGLVTEYYNMTELTNPVLIAPVSRHAVNLDTEIPAIIASPPANLADANRYWERLQGMRAQVPQNSLVISGRNVFSPPDGEIWIVNPNSTLAQRVDPYTNRAFRDAHPLDDNYDPANPGNWDGNGYRILMGSWGIKATVNDSNAIINPARTFSTVTNAPTGGINYSFSKYRIEVSAQPDINLGLDPAANNPPLSVNPGLGYSIADYNLENLYDYRNNPFSNCDFAGDAGCTLVTPFLSAITPPFDYVPANDAPYQARLTKIAKQIISDLLSPDILLVQEVENQDICSVTAGALTCGITDNADGKPDVLQELALKIASLGGPAYDAAFDRDSSDLRGILPGYLYRTDRVRLANPAGDSILGGTPVIDYSGASVPYNSDISNPKTLNAVLPVGVSSCETSWVFPRAPVIALFQVYQASIGTGSFQSVYVINNHFKSGPDTCVGHRTEEAKYNAAIVAAIQSANPTARVVVGGDFNVYPRPDDPVALVGKANSTDQLGPLYASTLGLTNLYDVVLKQAPQSAYTYVYVGMAQTLDQVFVNKAAFANLHQFRIAHINSDFAADNTTSDEPRGTSDHDPIVATFYWDPQEPTSSTFAPFRVDQGKNIQISVNATDPTGGPMTFAWDLNNDGTFETVGQSVLYQAGFVPGSYPVSVQVTGSTGLKKVFTTNVFVNYRIIFALVMK